MNLVANEIRFVIAYFCQVGVKLRLYSCVINLESVYRKDQNAITGALISKLKSLPTSQINLSSCFREWRGFLYMDDLNVE